MRLLAAAALLVFLLVAGAADAAALEVPAASGLTGFDVSSLGCGAELPYGSFGVVGVNSGRPFHYNPCLRVQARGGQALYLNTGYDPAYLSRITPGCARSARLLAAAEPERSAWAVGCSEAEGAVAYDSAALGAAPAMWWLDVEIMNSWSASTRLNRRALEGALDVLGATGRPVGAYSTRYQWGLITGGWHPKAIAGDWVAGAVSPEQAPFLCSSGFSGAPVLLVQYTEGPADFDFGC